MNRPNIFNNDPRSLIRFGNNEDVCHICNSNRIKESREREDITNPTDRWNFINELKGKLEYKPTFKLRYNGNDICICPEHIKEIYDELISVGAYKEETKEETKEEVKEEVKEDKKEDKKNEKKKK